MRSSHWVATYIVANVARVFTRDLTNLLFPVQQWRLASLCTYLVCMIMIAWVFFTGIHYDPSNYHEHVYSDSTDHTSLIIMLLESCPTVLSTSLSNNCHCQTAVESIHVLDLLQHWKWTNWGGARTLHFSSFNHVVTKTKSPVRTYLAPYLKQ